ncbi:cell wall-binding repeat-containing protein [Herbiconiux sp. P17]|uniref:cell wall-binding repeat-containing protein n=1 Tax=Herbiconiux wuyangfengii TaxID=3342794 RepID=UPI0035B6AC9B
MRWSVRWGVAAAAAAVLVGGFVAPASATPASTSARTDPASAPVAIQVPDAPFNRTITADYHRQLDGDVPAVPSSTQTLTVALPSEAAVMELTTVRWTIRGAAAGISGTAAVDPASGTISIEMTGGILTGGIAPRVDAGGRGYLIFQFDSTRDLQGPPAPPHIYSNAELTRAVTLTAFGAFLVGGAGAGESTTLDLARENATTFASTRSFWGQGPDGYWTRAGDTVTVSGGIDWAPGSTAELVSAPDEILGDDAPRIDLEETTDGDPASLAVTVPADADLTTYTSFNRPATLAITQTQGADHDYVFAPLTVGATTSVDGVDASRISGYDRFSTASAIANAQYPGGVDTVFVATGDTFADALSIAPVAALNGSPVMLASGDLFYQEPNLIEVAGQVGALNPKHLVFIGGEQSIPWVWEPGLSYGGNGIQVRTVQRIAGADRYEVSRNIALQEFPAGAKTVFLASGLTFPDALSAVPSAVSQKAPVILVRGGNDALDSQTTDLLQQLGATKVVIVGGPASVSSGIESQLRSRYSSSSVTRFGGADRFAVANAVNRAYFGSAPTAYLATGLRFTDALTGGVMAAREHAPLLLSRTECVPASDLDSLSRWKTSKVTLFGGTDSLNPSVMTLQGCG